MEKLKKKGKKYYILDWIFDLLVAGAFIYLSFQVREMMLQCVCPTFNFTLNSTVPIINFTFNNTTVGK